MVIVLETYPLKKKKYVLRNWIIIPLNPVFSSIGSKTMGLCRFSPLLRWWCNKNRGGVEVVVWSFYLKSSMGRQASSQSSTKSNALSSISAAPVIAYTACWPAWRFHSQAYRQQTMAYHKSHGMLLNLWEYAAKSESKRLFNRVSLQLRVKNLVSYLEA